VGTFALRRTGCPELDDVHGFGKKALYVSRNHAASSLHMRHPLHFIPACAQHWACTYCPALSLWLRYSYLMFDKFLSAASPSIARPALGLLPPSIRLCRADRKIRTPVGDSQRWNVASENLGKRCSHMNGAPLDAALVAPCLSLCHSSELCKVRLHGSLRGSTVPSDVTSPAPKFRLCRCFPSSPFQTPWALRSKTATQFHSMSICGCFGIL
jgi:hypothetical protein